MAVTKETRDNAVTIMAYCDVLLKQIASGMHANPSLATFMANPGGTLLSHDVQLIAYRHADDGKYYAHQFGGDDVQMVKVGGRQVIYLDALPERTGVDMRSDGRIVVLSRPDRKPLSEDFR